MEHVPLPTLPPALNILNATLLELLLELVTQLLELALLHANNAILLLIAIPHLLASLDLEFVTLIMSV